MKPTNDGGAVADPAHPITPDQLGEAFYSTEYRKMVKILRVIGATKEEAEDAAQRALEYIFKRSRNIQDPIDSLDAYVCRVAIRYFIKERQRDRKRQPREVKGGHLTLPAYLDDELTVWEDKQWVDHVLESLTPAQRDVIRLVADGASNQEIAEQLGKNNFRSLQWSVPPRELVAEMKKADALPALHGPVTFVLVPAAGAQPQLEQAQKDYLKAVWTFLLTAAGATSVKFIDATGTTASSGPQARQRSRSPTLRPPRSRRYTWPTTR